MNTLNPTKNPYLAGTQARTTTNNNRQGLLARIFGNRNNVNSLTQQNSSNSSSKQAQSSDITGTRTDIASSRSENSGQENQVNLAKANQNIADNSQIQGNTKEGGSGSGGGCAGGCGCGCS
jgi:type II secretory pathway component PulM